ncbi:hypothetical protein DYB28_012161, partial [Aphanomyces astaci]
MQAGMLAATSANPSAYTLQITLKLTDRASQSALERAFQRLVTEHTILQTTFASCPHGLFQIVPWSPPAEVAISHVSNVSIHDLLKTDLARGFTLDDPSFVRLAMLSSPQSLEVYGVLTIHHALIDGWSINSLLSDLMDLMDQLPLAPRPPFRSVVDYMENQDAVATRAFWQAYLANVVPTPISSHVSPGLNDVHSAPLSMLHSVSLAQLTRLASQTGVSVSELAKFAWAATVRKFSRQNDVVIGQVMANRGIPVQEADRILGPLLSTVPCRVTFVDESPLVKLLQHMQAVNHAMSASFSHASLVDVAKWSDGIRPDQLFDTMFAFQQWPPRRLRAGVEVIESWKDSQGQFTQNYAFELLVEPTSHGALSTTATFAPEKLSHAQAREILHEYDHTLTQLCAGLAADASQPTTALALWTLSPAQTELIHASSFGPDMELPFELLHHAFEVRAKEFPDARAVEFEGQWLSYGELNAQADAVACELAELGVCVGSRVAVIMDRSLEFPIGLLATLKVGAAIMALDVSFPVARLSFIVSDANVLTVVTASRLLERVRDMHLGTHVVDVAVGSKQPTTTFTPSPQHVATRNDEAFIVYTSGSTGKPKGVPVLHCSALNTVFDWNVQAEMTEGMRVLQFMAIGFDVCQMEVWATLSCGSCLVLRSDNDFEAMSSVNVLMCTPTGLGHLGCPTQYPNLQIVMVCGEVCPNKLKKDWSAHVKFINVYGPSECYVTHLAHLGPHDSVTIGRPIANVRCYILDQNQRQVPQGVVGEIYLGGIGVSPGYINLPLQTIERFVADPFDPAKARKMYRTGDLGRLLSNGRFDILGRMDSQVKVKGYRIELDEVANAMMQHVGVVSAAVIVKDKTHLVGYFTPASV